MSRYLAVVLFALFFYPNAAQAFDNPCQGRNRSGYFAFIV